MDGQGRLIVVTGATGHQGGAAARHLLRDGWRVRAITRDAGKPESHALYTAGAEIAVADLLDRGSLENALHGAYGVFSVETSREAGVHGEETEGRNLVDAARDAGVRHFVYDSVLGADRDAGGSWVVTKHHLEGYLRDSGLPWTIWRPSTFMENFEGRKNEILAGTLTGYEPADAVHHYIAVDDIGKFVALAFLEPDEWLGKATEIAGDRLRILGVTDVFSRVLGRPVRYEQVSPDGIPAPKPDETGTPPRQPDIEALRRVVPDLKTLEAWLLEQQWAAVGVR